ncbi:MAG: hypothetical protein NTV88_06390 [Candidatus Micrarchaeota archaeon]|nr:hypothetical protein [Candidatus Micrarchaeota archaeon]
MVATGQTPQAILLKTAESQLNLKPATVQIFDTRGTFAREKARLENAIRLADDTSKVTCSKKVLAAYGGMNVFKNESVQAALKEATIEIEGDNVAYDLPALRKKCTELGVAPKDIETLVNILRNAHQ